MGVMYAYYPLRCHQEHISLFYLFLICIFPSNIFKLYYPFTLFTTKALYSDYYIIACFARKKTVLVHCNIAVQKSSIYNPFNRVLPNLISRALSFSSPNKSSSPFPDLYLSLQQFFFFLA
jgi:hypothetical protein